MIDRIPGKPGGVIITPDDGSDPITGVLQRNDNPIVEGTPINKATLLTDETAFKYGFEDATATVDNVLSRIFDMLYPIGCIYSSSSSENPEVTFGIGTWQSYGPGKVAVCVDSTRPVFNDSKKTGGNWQHRHTLSANGFAAIGMEAESLVGQRQGISTYSANFKSAGGFPVFTGTAGTGVVLGGNTDISNAPTNNTSNLGAPVEFITEYRWERIA